MAHKFSPEKIGRLLREERYNELAPLDLLKKAGLKEGDTFADIGSGPGFFSLPASGIVGSGKVYAIDTQAEMLEALKKTNPPANVAAIISGENSIPLEDGAADFALVAFVLHETEDMVLFLKEVRRILKPKGTLLVIDWKKKKEEKGPPMAERLSAASVTGLLKKAGFKGIKASTLNPSHYSIAAKA
ncbi:MAG: class I SAM-dependent methyltransferase [Deltaproteobacteria bacterium]|nr:class I SAM-dependent methyltransferase [Deltaproteobacteria bacterium]